MTALPRPEKPVRIRILFRFLARHWPWLALARRVAQLGAPLAPDDPALAREVALLADRCDVAEELTRLAAHFDHAAALFAAPEPAGRKLDFLAQEMHREANTIGSKANDARIASAVIDLKALVETFREQVQNLE